MQDWGEFATVRLEPHANGGGAWPPELGMLVSAGRYRAEGEDLDASAIGDALALAWRRYGRRPYKNGDGGGNVEATHEGVPYVGDTMTAEARADLTEILGIAPIVLSTTWLAIGHVDEIVAFVPSPSPCGASLAYASPAEALNVLAEAGAREPDRPGLPPRAELAAAIARFRRVPSGFDVARPITSAADAFVAANLAIEARVREAADRLVTASKCLDDVFALPQLFMIDGGRAVAALPNVVNALVLGDHVILADPRAASLRDAVRARLGARLGGTDKVHFVADDAYFAKGGDVHCATNVVRERSGP
jgi:hypothetical protein